MADSNGISGLQFKPLGAEHVAEVTAGVDFSKPVPAETIAAIREGMARYGVLVFRKTGMDDAAHVAFASQFGDLEDHAPWIPPGQPYRLGQYTQLADVGNVDNDGTVTAADSIRHYINAGNGLFHVDCSYNPRRAGFSILRGHKLPPPGNGGSTLYADTRAAWRDLDEATKDKVKDLVLCHSLWYSRKLGAPECKPLQGIDPMDHPMGRHKAVQLHEPSGRMNLYIASHVHHIDGWSYEESRPLVDELLRHATQDKYVVQVDWENDGDVVMWDNTCVMHRGKQGAYVGKYIRDMRRATIYDNSSLAWGLNDRDSEESGMYSKTMKDRKWCDGKRPGDVNGEGQQVSA
ncbi:hypothetical protein PG997_002281 [Apiospora hydei]|uniref:TauD/TfdA-like domain-containing protein n=1 Tax=Apiospora hydei TaxID=1337664 RepID=A0ABR1X915_9PEZI